MSTTRRVLSQTTGSSDFRPPESQSPFYADNPFAAPEVASVWLRQLSRLFVGRRDTYADRALYHGSVRRVSSALTDTELWDHIRGNHCVYVYAQHFVERGAKFCVLDLDCHGEVPEGVIDDRAERNFGYMTAVWRRLLEFRLPVLLEASDGRGGLHLWLFVDSLSNAQAIAVTTWMAGLADPGDLSVERFPRGNIASEFNPGLCIRLPGRHHTQHHFSRFWNGESWVDAAAAVEMLNQLQPVAADGLPQEALRFQAPTSARSDRSGAAQQHVWTDQAVPPAEVIQDALGFLGEDHYDAGRPEWIHVGIGLHSCARTPAELDQYFDMWAEWSQQAPERWNEQAAQHDWDSFEERGPFQWQNLMRLAMDEGYDPPTAWHPDFVRQLNLDTASAAPFQPTPPVGDAVTIDVLRQEVLQSRRNSLGQPGIYLDRSRTGSGKSTADLEIAAAGNRVLILVPDHTNAREIAAEATSRGLQVIRFPKRVYGDPEIDQTNPPNREVNCWNPDADRAQSAGLAIQHTVCRGCPHAYRCRHLGYLGALRRATRTRAHPSAVVVLTHRRAQLIGMNQLCRTYRIQYVSVHESLLEFLAPVYHLHVGDVRQLLQQLNAYCTSADVVRRIGIVTEPVTTDPAQFARREYEQQAEYEASLTMTERQWRQRVRAWFQNSIRTLRSLEAVLTDGAASADAVNLTELAFPADDYAVQDLHALLWAARQQSSARLTGPQSGSRADRVDQNNSADAGQNSALRLLMELSNGSVRRLVRIPASSSPARLVAVSEVELPTGVPVWLNDATGDPDILRSIVPDVVDQTPQMHVTGHHNVLQVPEFDIARGQKSGPNSTIRRALRHVLPMYRDKTSICVFCHQNHIEGIRAQLPDTVTAVHYFHSALARGTNSLYQQHDLVLILGTPRSSGPAAVVDRLVQLGQVDALNEPGGWTTRSFQITDQDSQTRVIASRGYGHPLWDAAYNSIVEPELLQTIGRARPALPDGCEVVLVSAHLVCADFLEHPEISLTASQDRIWQVCRGLREPFGSQDIFDQLRVSRRTINLGLARFVELGYVEQAATGGGRNIRFQIVRRTQAGRVSAHDGGELVVDENDNNNENDDDSADDNEE